MGWFEEQIRQRNKGDQEQFEDAVLKMAAAIVGGGSARFTDEQAATKSAIDDILRYYHFRPAQIPGDVTDPEEQMTWALRPHGLMHRSVKLTKGWYRDAFGPMIVRRAADGLPVSVIPGTFGGYRYDDGTGRMVRVNAGNAADFSEDAVCFYRPLPLREIGIPDLLVYLRDCLSMGDLGLLLAFALIVTLVSMLLPHITKLLTGFVLESGNTSLLWGTALFMLTAAVSVQIFTASRYLVLARIEKKTSLAVEAAVMMRLFALPAPFFKKYSAGELANRSSAVGELCRLLIGELFSTGILSLLSLLYVTQITQFSPGLVGPALLIVAATALVSLITAVLQTANNRILLAAGAREQGLSYALITGVQKIKLSGAEKRAFSRWADCYAEEARAAYRPPFFLRISPAVTLAVSLGGTAALYYFAVRTGVTPSGYIAFNAAFGYVAGAFGAFSQIVSDVSRIRPILEMTEPILKTAPERAEDKEMITRLGGGIELGNVWFRYNESAPYVAAGIDLKIRSGEYIAIVGRTGCGKSTLMRLLLGFEKPERGAIYYDGKDLNRIDLSSLRRRIGVVMQDGSLFPGDIYSNIVIAAPWLTVEDAWEAAELAGIADDIRAMPMGMHTVIGEGQGGISGGQKQRLMIARALAPKPRILMFDEATSALDNRTQKQISEALDALGCTRIVIAHRLSTIKNCDRILVLDEGRIAESGTYEELIGRGGIFAELVKRQRLDD
ncbi:MAG: ATP-binding cassette domain-containing protein [Lachnospiraceae bacterium]|nr:ATP-binding cassette domain-containing protein [Lachnospiraceae bacterium]